jgi:hypothetical protein
VSKSPSSGPDPTNGRARPNNLNLVMIVMGDCGDGASTGDTCYAEFWLKRVRNGPSMSNQRPTVTVQGSFRGAANYRSERGVTDEKPACEPLQLRHKRCVRAEPANRGSHRREINSVRLQKRPHRVRNENALKKINFYECDWVPLSVSIHMKSQEDVAKDLVIVI